MPKTNILIEKNPNSILNPLYEDVIGISGATKKSLKLYGNAIICEQDGINGRSYPKRIMAPRVDAYVKKFIPQGRSYSELNHPRVDSENQGKDYSIFEINMMKVCALIEDLHFQGNDLKIKLKVVDNHPCGEAVKAIVEAGGRPGVSLRGAGSLVRVNNRTEISDDYRFITVDVVGNPSFDDDAVMDSLYESIKTGQVQILTEAADTAAQEFIKSRNDAIKLSTGRKSFNRSALVNLFEGISK